MRTCCVLCLVVAASGLRLPARRDIIQSALLASPLLPSPAVALSGQEAMRLEVSSRTAEGVLLPNQIRVIDLIEGSGPTPALGQKIYAHFKIWTKSFDRGQPNDASYFQTRPAEWTLGQAGGRIVPGLDIGVQGMKEGGWRRLIVPPELGYGDAGLDSKSTVSRLAVGPGEVLYVDIRLMDGGSGRCAELLFFEGAKSISCVLGKP